MTKNLKIACMRTLIAAVLISGVLFVSGTAYLRHTGYPWFFLFPPVSIATGWYIWWVIRIVAFIVLVPFFITSIWKHKNIRVRVRFVVLLLFLIQLSWFQLLPPQSYIFSDPQSDSIVYVVKAYAGRTKSYTYTEIRAYERQGIWSARLIGVQTKEHAELEKPYHMRDESQSKTYQIALRGFDKKSERPGSSVSQRQYLPSVRVAVDGSPYYDLTPIRSLQQAEDEQRYMFGQTYPIGPPNPRLPDLLTSTEENLRTAQMNREEAMQQGDFDGAEYWRMATERLEEDIASLREKIAYWEARGLKERGDADAYFSWTAVLDRDDITIEEKIQLLNQERERALHNLGNAEHGGDASRYPDRYAEYQQDLERIEGQLQSLYEISPQR